MRSVLASGEPTKNDPPLHLASKTGHVEIVRYGPRKAQVVPLHYVMFHSSIKASCYCLISYRAGTWHYRIFPDFLNSGLKMASKIEGKAKVIACS